MLNEIQSAEAGSSSSSTSCTRSSVRVPPKAPSAQATSSPMLARGAARRRRNDARRIPQADREGCRVGAPLPADLRGRAVGHRHDRDPARPEGALRSASRRAHPDAALSRPRFSPTATSPTGSSGQGDRPCRRSRVTPADGDRLEPDRARRSGSPRAPARDRARRDAEGVEGRARAGRTQLAEAKERHAGLAARWSQEKEALDRVQDVTSESTRCAWSTNARSAAATSTAPRRFATASCRR